jgi:hypothetical protein
MMHRGRDGAGQQADLSARARAAVGRLRGARPHARGGLTGAIAHAVGLRRAPTGPEPVAATADAAELHALRSDLVRELDRVAGQRSPEPEESGSPAAQGAQADATS